MKRKCLMLLSILIIGTSTQAEIASWYAGQFEGRTTASGYIYDSSQMTCASNKYKFGTVLGVTNKRNGNYIEVVVTDTGSFTRKYGRDIDLSKEAFRRLDKIGYGILDVDIKVVDMSKIFRYKKGRPLFKEEVYEM